jgi:hypothetical protein
MDKVKAQATVLADKAQTGVQQGQTKLAEMQTGKQVDHLLRELGAYVFLSERGRLQPDSEAKVAGLMDQLDALEAAGTPVAVTPEPMAAPAPGTAPPSGAVPQAAPAAPTSADPVPPAAPAAPTAPVPPAAGGGIPQSSNRMPGQ